MPPEKETTAFLFKMLEKNQEEMILNQRMLCDKLDNLKDNHIAHLREDIAEIKIAVTENTTDTKWIKIFVPLIVGAAAALTILLQRMGV